MEFYYSAPASPRRNRGPALDEFEFETSRRFDEHPLSESSGPFVVSGGGSHDRRESLPAMAFAEDLFFNGLVMPLKPPPRLHTSPLSSPKSPRTVCKIPFSRKNSWNDDFDPFTVALEKVREEKRGRNCHHRRSRSYSPFRVLSRSSSTVTADDHSQDLSIEPMAKTTATTVTVSVPSHSGPLDFKGSAYARWVRDQTMHGLSPKSPSSFLFRQRVRPLNGSSPAEKDVGKKRGKAEESKVKKLKVLLVKYASFGRGNGGNKQTKTSTEVRNLSYFSRLSFKLKGNAHGSNTKKKIPDESKMAVVQYKPSIAVCLGYGDGNTVEAK